MLYRSAIVGHEALRTEGFDCIETIFMLTRPSFHMIVFLSDDNSAVP